MAQVVRIENMRAVTEGGLYRACADVDGRLLWFESSDAELRPAPEAFGCAMLPAAVARRADLVLDATVDATWEVNIRALQRIWRRWWHCRRAVVRSQAVASPAGARAKGVALCFSGGVDSFFSLLRAGLGVDHLVFVHGYDIKLADLSRTAAAERSLREVAAAVGAKAVVIRTNLREHPTFLTADWERAHGGALAAVGYLLQGAVGTLAISASYPHCYEHPWGSHWDTDPRWSSSRLEVVHIGAEHWRADKLRAIADEELVRRHLRVCWENRSPQGNCGRCEKCIRTMLILAQAGCLEDFQAFDGGTQLVASIDELPFLRPELVPIYAGFMGDSTDRHITTALERLIARSRSRRPPRSTRTAVLTRRIAGALRRRICHWRRLQ